MFRTTKCAETVRNNFKFVFGSLLFLSVEINTTFKSIQRLLIFDHHNLFVCNFQLKNISRTISKSSFSFLFSVFWNPTKNFKTVMTRYEAESRCGGLITSESLVKMPLLHLAEASPALRFLPTLPSVKKLPLGIATKTECSQWLRFRWQASEKNPPRQLLFGSFRPGRRIFCLGPSDSALLWSSSPTPAPPTAPAQRDTLRPLARCYKNQVWISLLCLIKCECQSERRHKHKPDCAIQYRDENRTSTNNHIDWHGFDFHVSSSSRRDSVRTTISEFSTRSSKLVKFWTTQKKMLGVRPQRR